MEQILELKSLTGDAFLTLPLLIIAFLFFFGTMTSNIGMLYLFLGHLLIAPALSFLSNEKGPFLFDQDKISIPKALKWFYSMLVFLNVNASSIESLTGSSLSYLLNFLLLVPGIGQFIARDSTPFFFLNPKAWFSDYPPSQPSPPNCAILPGYSEKDAAYSTPSSWLTHISFFFGFILSNAMQILNRPDPVLSSTSTDSTQQKKREQSLENRIRNRKWIAGSIVAICIFFFLALIAARFIFTSCEYSFSYSLVPIILTTLTGASWFTLVFSKCGIQPADILGIVQGFIDQDLIDNPIVCVGS
jgi:hypothetical protein